MPRLSLDPSSAPQSRDSSPSKPAHLASQASEASSHSHSHSPAEDARKRLLSGYDTHACDETDGACEHGLLSPREDSPPPGVYERRGGRVVRVGVVDEERGRGNVDVDGGVRVGKARWGMRGGGEKGR